MENNNNPLMTLLVALLQQWLSPLYGQVFQFGWKANMPQ